MKFSRLTILWGIVLGFSGIFSSMQPALGQDDRTTAGEVVDPETNMVDRNKLKAFVLSARDYVSSITNISQLIGLQSEARKEGGDWNSGNIYLVVLLPTGTVQLHGEDPELDGKDILDLEDDTGKKVVQQMLAAAESMEDGDFVEYTWDDPSDPNDTNPKVCYAVGYTVTLLGLDFILVGGFYQDISEVENVIDKLPEHPEVSAGDVRDRETLKAFVQRAGKWALGALRALNFDLPMLETMFREEGGHWRDGSTYMFMMTTEGNVLFHGARPDQEDQIKIDLEDRNGFMFIRALIEKAKSGGGYVEYYWDDPGVVGDEEFGSAKVGYAQTFTVPDDFPPQFAGQTVVAGSGFYKGNQVALDFAHFANGGGITSDIVLVNAASKAVQPAIYFYGKDGKLIDPELVVDVMEQGLEVKSYGALTVPNGMPSLGELTIPTHGRGGDVMTGSVKVVSDAPDSPIGGVLRFDLTGTGVAGVGASQPVRDAIFPARRMEDGINTGAAFRNLSESGLTLTCRLMKDGQKLGDDTVVDLPANGQDAKFIDEMFGEELTSDFTGSVRCMAPLGDQQFTAVALELEAMKVFTTLPVVPVAMETISQE